jgi:hypothetical protein
VSGEIESQSCDEFVDGLSNDHFPHVHSEQRGTFGNGFSLKDLFIWSIGCPLRTALEFVLIACRKLTYRANAAKVSIIRLTHSNCTAVRTLSFEPL